MTERLHAYKMIYEVLVEEIKSGKYSPGERLPTEKELCERFAVSRITSKSALDLLRHQGVVERVRGRGTYIRQEECAAEPPKPVNGKLIGVIMPDFTDAFGTGMLYGIEQACADAHVFFTLRRSGNDALREQRCIAELLELGVSGLAVMPLHGEYYNNSILKLIIDQFPIVIMDRMYRGIESNFVGTDNLSGAAELTRFLLDEKHRNIALVSTRTVNTSTLEDRIEGFLKAFAERGIQPNRELWFMNVRSTLPMNSTPEMIQADKAALLEHLRSHPEITAVFAFEYNIAVLVHEVATELNLRVPEDIAIVCFDAPSGFAQGSKYTCIQQKQEEIGRRAVERLFELIRTPGATQEKRVVELDAPLVINRDTV